MLLLRGPVGHTCRCTLPKLQRLPAQQRQARRAARAAASNGAHDKLVMWNISPAPGSCPFAQRAWIALEELGIPYETRLVDKAAKTQEFAELYTSIWPDPQVVLAAVLPSCHSTITAAHSSSCMQATSKVPIIVGTPFSSCWSLAPCGVSRAENCRHRRRRHHGVPDLH